MAVGLSAAEANAIVNGLDNLYMQLHVDGDPGAAGTANPATETRRVQISLTAASGGSASNDTAIEWLAIAGSQDPSHYSLWTAATGGVFEFSGTITADAYTAGQDWAIATGDLVISITTVAA